MTFLPRSATGDPIPNASAASTFSAGEGSTAMSDTNGNLLFYAGSSLAEMNTSSIWNRNHTIMPNGAGLIGGSSSSQNAMVVRLPGSFTRYYVFTVAQLENYGTARPKTFNYSVVDMTLQGGLGDVMPNQKNIPLMDSTTERITAVQHSNTFDTWIITHKFNSDAFVAVLLTDTGLSSPVYSHIGLVHGPRVDKSRGCIKVSPDGTKVAVAITEAFGNGTTAKYHTQVGKFNTTTGQVTDIISITKEYTRVFGPYGVEWSNSSEKLYISYRDIYKIHQHSFEFAYDSATVAASKYEIDCRPFEPAALQMGMDGKIYISKVGRDPTLARIANPNATADSIEFLPNAIRLAPGTSCDRGLTNVNQSIFNPITFPVAARPKAFRPSLRVWPNPASTFLQIAGFDYRVKSPAIQILNADGRVLQVPQTNTQASILRISISHLPAGLYTLKQGAASLHFSKQ